MPYIARQNKVLKTYFCMAEACALYGKGSCTAWQRLVYCIAEARVLYGRGLFTVLQGLVYCIAESRVLYDRGMCMYCMAVRKARFCRAEAHSNWGFPPSLEVCGLIKHQILMFCGILVRIKCRNWLCKYISLLK